MGTFFNCYLQTFAANESIENYDYIELYDLLHFVRSQYS